MAVQKYGLAGDDEVNTQPQTQSKPWLTPQSTFRSLTIDFTGYP
jgi:hypothetical protein